MVYSRGKHTLLGIYHLSYIFCLRRIFLRHRLHGQNHVRGNIFGFLSGFGTAVLLYETFVYNGSYKHDKHGDVFPHASFGLGQLAAAYPRGYGNSFRLLLLQNERHDKNGFRHYLPADVYSGKHCVFPDNERVYGNYGGHAAHTSGRYSFPLGKFPLLRSGR